MACVLIGVPVHEGAGRVGAEAGPQALRSAGLHDALRQSGLAFQDAGDLSLANVEDVAHPNTSVKALCDVAAWTKIIAKAASSVPNHQTPVFLGGDHSIAMGTLTGLAQRARAIGRPFFVLWIDAHPDCHTLQTTVSGHIHGTPVAYAMGEAGFGAAFPAVKAPVDADNICMIGIRSVDRAELNVLHRRRIDVHTANDVAMRGVSATLEPFLQRVRDADGILHVSFDVDAVDPGHAPGVGTPVEGGLSLQQVHDIMAMVRDSDLLGSLDLVELNPFLDRGRRTADLMVDLAATALDPRSKRCGTQRVQA